MKKRNTLIATLLSLFFAPGIVSCNDWLEVDSSSNVIEEVLFEDPAGFRTAVNGVYRLLSQQQLYGRELTWGALSVLGNNYDATRLPGGSTSSAFSYREMAAGNYASSYTADLIDPIWEQGYRVIANCNNIIQYTNERDGAFFIEGEVEKKMILGEMLGLRAMMHLDILRLFAPATRADDGKTYIPYVTAYPEKQPEHLTVAATLDKIIADLEQARTLLAEVDTVAYPTRLSSWSARLTSAYSTADFISKRGTHFNYFAAAAILARAYQWRGATGDAEKAYQAARGVYIYSVTKTWFTFTPSTNLAVVENNVHRKMPHDIIFTLFNNNLYAMVAAATPNATSQSFFIKNDGLLFGGSYADDFRLNLINADKTSRRWTIPTGNQTAYPTADIIRQQGPLAPVVRLTEMAYIMCEYLVDVDMTQAVTILTRIKTARGSKTPVNSVSKEAFLEDLYLEMTREFLAEGQTFFLYKRLNKPMYNGAGVIDMTGRYALPIPYSEASYYL
ncbi:MAG: RagB/SusD family nutrient uptake outer membrane protein [Odoribacteraceae bacterium]|jgi:hypothetical protein|nr:RagB/SusD family nutrient uptake outer membrane protein [Odoribacteraceae bacterium]